MQRNESMNCDSCGGQFDPRNSPWESVDTKYQQFTICGSCFHGYTETELAERLESPVPHI